MLQTSLPKIHCEDHSLTELELNGRAVISNEFSEPINIAANKHFAGLCGNCELRNICLWRNESAVVFNCEHFL
jgi:hypothetical protein